MAIDSRPLNVQIAEALGWKVWEHTKRTGEWFMERPCATNPTMIEFRPVPDYVAWLRTSPDARLKSKNNLLKRTYAEAAQMGRP